MIASTDGIRWQAGCTGDGWADPVTYPSPEQAHAAARAHAAEPRPRHPSHEDGPVTDDRNRERRRRRAA